MPAGNLRGHGENISRCSAPGLVTIRRQPPTFNTGSTVERVHQQSTYSSVVCLDLAKSACCLFISLVCDVPPIVLICHSMGRSRCDAIDVHTHSQTVHTPNNRGRRSSHLRKRSDPNCLLYSTSQSAARSSAYASHTPVTPAPWHTSPSPHTGSGISHTS